MNQPLPEDDPKQRQPDISKAKRMLGWEPVVTLEEGLQPHDRVFPDIYAEMAASKH